MNDDKTNDRPAVTGPVAHDEATRWALLCEEVAIEDWVYRRDKAREAMRWALASGLVLLVLVAALLAGGVL